MKFTRQKEDIINFKEELILNLYKIGAVEFGRFVFVSGLVSPNYVDLRILSTYPEILSQVADLMFRQLKGKKFAYLAPVPYAAIPLGCALSIRHNLPMLLVRKERHKTGTGNLIEGKFKKGKKVILVDDVVTNGESKLKFIRLLENEGLKVTGVLTFMDRNQGGAEQVKKAGYPFYKVFDLTWVFKTLRKYNCLPQKQFIENLLWLKEHSF